MSGDCPHRYDPDDTFVQRCLFRLKNAIYAPPKEDANKAQLRVGLIGGDIPVYPPLAFLLWSGCGMLGWFLSGNRMRYLPRGRFASSVSLRCCLGAVLVMGSGKLAKTCRKELEKSGSKPNFAPVVQICDTGIYSYGRNYMYVSVLALPIAGSIMLDTAWLLFSTFGMGSYLNFIVIPAEEKLLRTEFGKSYANYCERVPRWFRIFK